MQCVGTNFNKFAKNNFEFIVPAKILVPFFCQKIKKSEQKISKNALTPTPGPCTQFAPSEGLNLRFRLYTCVQEVLQVVMLCFHNSGAKIAYVGLGLGLGLRHFSRFFALIF
jgi:hypothetical protein